MAAVLLGIAISSKQTMFWMLILAPVVLRFDRKRTLAMITAAIVPILPFLIWDWRALYHACFEFLASLPARRDALCFPNALWRRFHVTVPSSSGFVLAGLTVAFVCARAWKRRATENQPLVDFAEATLLTYFVFFFFNRWAFANYYFLLTGLAALSASAMLGGRKDLSAPGTLTGADPRPSS